MTNEAPIAPMHSRRTGTTRALRERDPDHWYRAQREQPRVRAPRPAVVAQRPDDESYEDGDADGGDVDVGDLILGQPRIGADRGHQRRYRKPGEKTDEERTSTSDGKRASGCC